MNIAIISGSNRPNSGSRKTADYIGATVAALSHENDLFDMHEIDLPMWSGDMWNSDSDQAGNWQQYRTRLEQCDALVVVAAEWNGTVPPSLQNFIMHLDRPTVGHKPVLLIGVSGGISGAYPIAELKSSINKNNRMVLVPDHVIVRHVGDDFDAGEHPIGSRIVESVRELIVYAKHLEQVRDELDFDYDQFAHGM